MWVKHHGKSFLIDASTDLRQQALTNKIERLDAVLITHPHADHIHGLDELRSFNFIQKERIPIYGNAWSTQELNQKFEYIFKPKKVEGGGIPLLDLTTLPDHSKPFRAAGVEITPIPVMHGSQRCLGFRFDALAYVTDCSHIPQESLDQLRGLDVLILDCLRLTKHPTHFNLDDSLQVIDHVRPKRTFLTHMGHDIDFEKLSKTLPKGVQLAFDGLTIRVGSKGRTSSVKRKGLSK